MFNVVFDIYMKIKDEDCSCNNLKLKEIIYSSFSKTLSNDYELPIERVIVNLIAKISHTSYLNKYGNTRYLLENDIFNK